MTKVIKQNYIILFKTLTCHRKSTNADNSVTPVENFAPIKIKSFCYEVRTEDNVSVTLQVATSASCIINCIPAMGIPRVYCALWLFRDA